MKKTNGLYELLFIIRFDTEEKAREKLVEKIKKQIETLDGKIEKDEPWGKKTLMYPVKKNHEGFYHLLTFSMPAPGVFQLDKKLHIDENVVRYLLTKGD